MTPQETAMQNLEQQGFKFSNWISSSPDANGESDCQGGGRGWSKTADYRAMVARRDWLEACEQA